MPHKITLSDAVRLIHSYIYLSPFEPIKNNLPIGGHVWTKNIEGKPMIEKDWEYSVKGTRSWYISDNTEQLGGERDYLKNSKYFSVAFETAYIRDTYNPEKGIKSPILYTCKKESMIFMDPDKSVDQFLIEYTGSAPSEQELSAEMVEVMSKNFAINFPCNPTSVAFFINDDNEFDIDDFLKNEGIKSVRFFYGYDPLLDRDNIRLILMGVDEYSHNILGKNAVILEKSWPPR